MIFQMLVSLVVEAVEEVEVEKTVGAAVSAFPLLCLRLHPPLLAQVCCLVLSTLYWIKVSIRLWL